MVADADREQAWQLLSFALDVPDAWEVTRALLLALAPKMELAGFREGWIPYLEKGWRCAQDLGDWETAAECELQIGLLYRLMSRFEEAHQWTTSSVEHFAALSKEHGQARALNELAWLEQLRHRFEKAQSNARQALALSLMFPVEQAMAHRVIGMVAIWKKQWDVAEKHHYLALKLFEQNGDQRRATWIRQNIGLAFRLQHRFDEAISCLQQAVKTLMYLEDHSHYAVALMNLSGTYYESGKINESKTLALQAINISKNLHDNLNLARLYTTLGLVYLALQEYDMAQTAFQRSADLHKMMGNRNLWLNSLDGLGMTLLAAARYDEAIVILEQAITELSKVQEAPNYEYLKQSLYQHLQEAKGHSAIIEIAE